MPSLHVLLQQLRQRLSHTVMSSHSVGQLGFPPQQGSETCLQCSSIGSGSSTPAAGAPGILARPARLTALDRKSVVGAAASLFNTAVLTADGELFMLGSNESGLLARRPRQQQQQLAAAAGGSDVAAMEGVDEPFEDFSWQPVRVEALEPYPLGSVALGGQHALAVTQQVDNS
jgi:alpha-tubulin suppressor-like RCC1 family protein